MPNSFWETFGNQAKKGINNNTRKLSNLANRARAASPFVASGNTGKNWEYKPSSMTVKTASFTNGGRPVMYAAAAARKEKKSRKQKKSRKSRK
jgi:hypothetical protein